MVKGITRRVILVDAPAGGAFEQAIFILPREEKGVTREQLVDEAVRIAKSYARTHGYRRRPPLKNWVWAAAGAAVIGLTWLLISLV